MMIQEVRRGRIKGINRLAFYRYNQAPPIKKLNLKDIISGAIFLMTRGEVTSGIYFDLEAASS